MDKEKSLLGNKNIPSGIACHELKVQYRHQVAIENVTGTFEKGSMTAIVGPNGGGKTTLLKVVQGLIAPNAGYLDLGGFSRKDFSYLPQNTYIDRSFPLRVYDVVTLGLCSQQGFFKRFRKCTTDRVLEALKSVGLEDCANRPLHALSGGQFQRVLFARMALQDAKVILLDEPFTAIDAPTMELLAGVLCEWRKQGKTIITVLHDMEIVRDFFPTTLVLARQVMGWGDTQEVLSAETLKNAKDLSRRWDMEVHEPHITAVEPEHV